jgi:copper(I)-binding protein
MMNILKSTLTALAVAFAAPAFAGETITVTDAYARFMPGAMAGAAFMQIENHGAEPDRLVGAASDIAERVELHTHKASSDGVMQMMHVPEGFEVPAGGSHTLARGGDHVMFMGLDERPAEGATISVVLTFEKAGEVKVDIPVDNAR